MPTPATATPRASLRTPVVRRLRLALVTLALLGTGLMLGLLAVINDYHRLVDHLGTQEFRLLQQASRQTRALTEAHQQLLAILIATTQGQLDEPGVFAAGKQVLDELDLLLARLQQDADALAAQHDPGHTADHSLWQHTLLREASQYRKAASTALQMVSVDPAQATRYLIRSSEAFAQANLQLAEGMRLTIGALEVHLQQLSTQSAQRLSIILVAALLACSVAALLLTRRLRIFLRQLAEIDRRLGDLQLGQTGIWPTTSFDPEFAALSDTLDQLRLAVQAQQLSVEALEQRVAERTHDLALYQQAFAMTDQAMLLTDAHATILDVNPAYERITGYRKADVLGRNAGITRSGRHDAGFYAAMWHALAQEGRWTGEIWDRRQNGEMFPKWLHINALRDAKGEVMYIGSFLDISRHKAQEARLQALAHHDPLTGLANRMALMLHLEHAISLARRNQGLLAVLFIDLDHFKAVNDQLGHHTGDALLCEVAERLRQAGRTSDFVARLGGDEFVVVAEYLTTPEDAGTVAGKLLLALQQLETLANSPVRVTPSIGIALYPEHGDNADHLLASADQAMYRAKNKGRNAVALAGGEVQEGA